METKIIFIFVLAFPSRTHAKFVRDVRGGKRQFLLLSVSHFFFLTLLYNRAKYTAKQILFMRPTEIVKSNHKSASLKLYVKRIIFTFFICFKINDTMIIVQIMHDLHIICVQFKIKYIEILIDSCFVC